MNSHRTFFFTLCTWLFALTSGCETESTSSTGSGGAGMSSSSSASSSSESTSSNSVASSSGMGGTGGMGTGGMAVGGSAGTGTGGNDLALLSDTFEGNTLSSDWMVFRPEVLNITVANGALSLRLDQQALWYQNNRGPLVYKFVTGNFKMTSRVRVRKTSNPAEPPSKTVHLGGLMARDPQGEMPGATENYVFIVVGFDEMDLSVETKTTVNSVSTYEGPAWPSGDAELRLCRVGSMFHLYKRALGGATFTLAKSYDRPDLPAKLQVGGNVYSASAPDLIANFDEITFADATSESDCAAN